MAIRGIAATIFSFFVLAASAHAEVKSCVIDGGGGDFHRRLCGIHRYASFVRGIYVGHDMSETLLSGDGNAPGGDCHMGVYFTKDAQGEFHKVPDDDLTKDYAWNTADLAPANARSQVLPASAANAQNACWRGAGPSDVCHTWSSNHGETRPGHNNSALVLYEPKQQAEDAEYYDSAKFRDSMNASHCGTQRFVFNNCYSGGMMSALFDEKGRLIPGRCGSASTATYEVARGGADMPPQYPITNGPKYKGQTMYGAPPKYDYTEAFTSALHWAPPGQQTLDDAHFMTLLNDHQMEQPSITSDFYMDHFFENRRKAPGMYSLFGAQYLSGQDVKEQAACYGDDLTHQNFRVLHRLADDSFTVLRASGAGMPPVHAIQVQASVTDAEADAIQADVNRVQNQTLFFETQLCTQINDEIKTGIGTDCATAPAAQKSALLRRYYLTRYAPQRDALAIKFRDCIKKYGSEFDEDHCAPIGRDINKFFSNLREMRRYEAVMRRLGDTLDFYRAAPAAKIREYLGLRRCETSNFFGPVPPAPGGTAH